MEKRRRKLIVNRQFQSKYLILTLGLMIVVAVILAWITFYINWSRLSSNYPQILVERGLYQVFQLPTDKRDYFLDEPGNNFRCRLRGRNLSFSSFPAYCRPLNPLPESRGIHCRGGNGRDNQVAKKRRVARNRKRYQQDYKSGE